jgi:EAL domain-containing protein (putative c-di-GMP-specific phosphodiesterase class I)
MQTARSRGKRLRLVEEPPVDGDPGELSCPRADLDEPGMLIVEDSGRIAPLNRRFGKRWRIPQGGKTVPLNQRFARMWQIPQQIMGRLSQDVELRHALERGELTVHYQPEANVRTGSIVGVEALARWQHPQRGLVLPDEFIPLAEQTGVIVSLGEWVMRVACAEGQMWQAAGRTPFRVAVNVSPRQFTHPNLVGMVAESLENSGLDPSSLELEVTEGAAMQNAALAIGILRDLKATGIRIALDDFGTGYSSLAYLKEFPIDTLKIDRSFVSGVMTEPNDAAIVTAIIAIAHSLELDVVAEGVETVDQLAFLKERDCDRFQGFLLSQAVPSEELILKAAG